jgi:hypothetical protein
VTVVVVRDGVMASDSRATIESEAGGIRFVHCEKIYKIPDLGVVVGVAGDGFAALRFVEWIRTKPKKNGRRKRDDLLVTGEADFSALVLHKDGKLEEYDRWLTPEEVILGVNQYYAIGCGAKAAMGAMAMGADAKKAVEVTCGIDPLCSLPVVAVDVKTDL